MNTPARASLLLVPLILLAAPAAAQPSPSIPDEDWFAAQSEREGDLDLARRIRLTAPFAAPRNAFFQSTLGLPLLRDARPLPHLAFAAKLRWSVTQSVQSAYRHDAANRFDGIFWEWLRLELSLGLWDGAEVFASARVSGWDERRDVFRVYTGERYPSVEGERQKIVDGRATGRHENLSDVRGGVKLSLWRSEDDLSALALSAELKSPGLRRADITNSNTIDLVLTLLGTLRLGDWTLHGNGGVVVPFGEQWIFDPGSGVDTPPVAQGALGVTWAPTDWFALGASLEASSPGWEGVDLLDHVVVTGAAGARFLWDRWSLELGGGSSLTRFGPDYTAWVELGIGF